MCLLMLLQLCVGSGARNASKLEPLAVGGQLITPWLACKSSNDDDDDDDVGGGDEDDDDVGDAAR